MSDFQPPVYSEEESSRPLEFDDLPSLQEFVNSLDPKRREFIEKLPTLNEDDLKRLNQADSFCPICYNTFGAIIAEAELASALDTPAVATQHLGVTRLAETCGHVFCRKDITTWVERNDKCPTCRTPFYEAPHAADEDEERFFRPLQGFTLGDRMPSIDDIQWGGMFGARPTAASDDPHSSTPQPASEDVASAATANPAEPSTNANDMNSNGTSNGTATSNSNSNGNNPQRAENDAQIERMLERMRGLGQATALSDIMFGLSATMGRGRGSGRQTAREEPDDDRNEYAGLYS